MFIIYIYISGFWTTNENSEIEKQTENSNYGIPIHE